MAGITFNGYDLADGVQFISTDINYRSFPDRSFDRAKLDRRPGEKFLDTDFGSKSITVNGHIIATTASGLQGIVDEMQLKLAQPEKSLIINSDVYSARTYVASCANLAIPERNYNQTYLPFSAEFISTDPFSYGTQYTASGVVTSGTVTFSGVTTISGSVFAEPVITLRPTGALVGNSNIKEFRIAYPLTGEFISASGIINYLSPMVFSYSGVNVTNSGIQSDFRGIFSRWEPGPTPFTITTTSGVNNGYLYHLTYRARYY